MSSRSCLILMRAVLMDSWADDTENSRCGVPGPNINTTIFCKTLHACVDEWQNQTASHILIALSLIHYAAIVVNEAVPCPIISQSRFFLFLVRDDPSSIAIQLGSSDLALLTYCCAHRVDTGNGFPLCESVRVRWTSFVKFQIIFVNNY